MTEMEKRLAGEKISILLRNMAIPAICAQIVSLLYNIVDRMYIGHMSGGTMAMAAIGICVPLTSIITAFTGLFGRGGSPWSSIALGRNDYDEAEKILGNSALSLVISSVMITVITLLLINPVLYLFGASSETIGYAEQYLRIYILGTVFLQLSIGLNYFINAQGFTRDGMITTMLGAVMNIILDPIFIFTLDMGISGAAAATVLSQAISCLWVLKFFFSKKSILRLRKKFLKFEKNIMRKIIVLGASPFFMSSSEGLLTIAFNRQLLLYGGAAAVSAMTIMSSMFNLLLLPVEGIAQGSQPIISFNYGSGQYHRVRETIALSARAALTFSFFMTVLIEIFPQLFVGVFTGDSELTALASQLLRVYIFGCIVIGANSIFQQTYNSLGEGKCSFFFAFYRKIILLIPLIFILPLFFTNKVIAVVLAEPVSDLLTTATNAVVFKKFIDKKLGGTDHDHNICVTQGK